MNHLKGYASVEEAARSKAGLQPDAVIEEDCWACGLVHVRQPKQATPASRLVAARTPGIPAAVRVLVLRRDDYRCVRCGKSIIGIPYSLHHIKRRSQGGRNVPECLITLDGTGTTGCHGWVHANIAAARASGWLMLSTDEPGHVPLLCVSEHGSGMTVFLTDDGRYSAESPGEVAA